MRPVSAVEKTQSAFFLPAIPALCVQTGICVTVISSLCEAAFMSAAQTSHLPAGQDLQAWRVLFSRCQSPIDAEVPPSPSSPQLHSAATTIQMECKDSEIKAIQHNSRFVTSASRSEKTTKRKQRLKTDCYKDPAG